MRLFLLTLGLAMALTPAFSAAQSLTIVEDPVAAEMAEPALPRAPEDYERHDSLLMRVVRDYNNDGLRDVALVPTDMCGQGTGCEYALYIARADGRFTHVGALPAYAESEDLKPVRPGVARLLHCHITRDGEYDGVDALLVSEEGIQLERSFVPTPAEAEAICSWVQRSEQGWRPDFFTEQCSMRGYLNTGRCEWLANE